MVTAKWVFQEYSYKFNKDNCTVNKTESAIANDSFRQQTTAEPNVLDVYFLSLVLSIWLHFNKCCCRGTYVIQFDAIKKMFFLASISNAARFFEDTFFPIL